MSFRGIIPWVVIAVVVLSLLPIWRVAGQGRYNAWEAIAVSRKQRHITKEEAIEGASEAYSLSPASF